MAKMMTNLFRALVVPASICCSGAVMAQDQDMYSQPAPPQIPMRDAFGVNLLSATWQYDQPFGLKSDIDSDLDFHLFTTKGGIQSSASRLTRYLSGVVVGNSSTYTVVIGPRAFAFQTTNGPNFWVDTSATGNTLKVNLSTGIYTFTDRDGVKHLFDPAPFNSQPAGASAICMAGQATNSPHICAVGTQVQFPDGKVITLGYDTLASLISGNTYRTRVRMKYARSSNGISLHFNYLADGQSAAVADWVTLASAKMVNEAFDFCNYPSGSCTAQFTWPSMTYSRAQVVLPNGNNGPSLTATDPTGAAHNYLSATQNNKLWIRKGGVNGPIAESYSNDQGPNNRDGPSPPSFADFVSAAGTLYQYRYTEVSGPNSTYLEIHGKRTSSDGRVLSFIGNRQLPRSSVIVQTTDENNHITNYTYDNYLRATRVDFPEGNAEAYIYDSNGNVTQATSIAKPGSGLANIARSATYPLPCNGTAVCSKPITVTDSRGNAISNNWDQTTGNLLSSTRPADANGIQPVTRYTYSLLSAWIANGSGGYMSSGAPRSLLTEVRTCRATATVGNACAGGSGDEVVTTYYYGPQAGPNNLQLRGESTTVAGVALVKCFGYDRLGNRISETTPNANVQVCP